MVEIVFDLIIVLFTVATDVGNGLIELVFSHTNVDIVSTEYILEIYVSENSMFHIFIDKKIN